MTPAFDLVVASAGLPVWLGWTLLAASAGTVFGTLVMAAQRDRLIRLALVLGLVWTVAVGAGWLWQRDPGVPLQWITVLHEGSSDRSVLHLSLSAANVGPFLRWLAGQVSRSATPQLRDLVGIQLALTVATVGWLFLLLAVRLRSVLIAAALAGCLAFAPQVHDAALSEHVGPVGMALSVLGLAVISAARAVRHAATTWWSVAACAALGATAACTRVEWLIVALPAVAARLAAAVPRVQYGMEACWSAAAKLAVRLPARAARVGPGLLIGVWVWLMANSEAPNDVRWAIRAIVPLSDWVEALPMWLVSLPVALVVLIGLGVFTHGSRRQPRSWGLLAGCSLTAVYHSASHGVLQEWLRYTTVLLPGLVWLAASGVQHLQKLAAQRAWPAGWGWVAAALALVLSNPCTTDPWLHLRLGSQANPFDPLAQRTNGSLQTEVRWLLEQTQQAPHCAFVSRVATSGQPDHFAYLVFGGMFARPARVQLSSGRALEAALVVVPHAGCVRYVRSWDCTRPEADCEADHKHGQVLQTHHQISKLYSDPTEYGVRSNSADLSVFALADHWSGPLDLPAPPPAGGNRPRRIEPDHRRERNAHDADRDRRSAAVQAAARPTTP